MCGKVFIKRALPFFLTFSVALFIVSFFVAIPAPNFQFNNGFRRHQQYHRMLEFENQRLREENSRLKAVSELKLKSFSGTFETGDSGNFQRVEKMEATTDANSLNDLVPPPPPISPARVHTIPYRVK